MYYLRMLKKSLPVIQKWPSWKRVLSSRAYASLPQVNYKADSTLLGYSVKQVESIPELNLVAVYLEHAATKAQHLHLACDDSNNLFGVAFRTPPPNSSGVAHILEHLALCGSKNFPCRDPFFNMLNRSLSTFMNAFTGSDLTIYAFSSQNRKDFENLLSVYLDAAFYPSLLEKDFRQEGWRLEHADVNDKNSPIILKGVVFNEMKGVYSDPGQYYARHLQNSLFPCNVYSHDSGGDPIVIPELLPEQLRHFHARLYHPSNSRFFTYGNMPLEMHLERIQTHVLDNYESIQVSNEVPEVIRWQNPRSVTIHNRFDPMAAVPEKQTVVSESYVLDSITNTYENFALSIIGTLLIDGPNAPFYQKLLQSGIGPDYSPCTGFDSSIRESVFSVGLREISENDVGTVTGIISETFNDVIKNGFPKEQVESVLHRIELGMKHRTSNFGLNCALGVYSMWNHNGNPITAFKVNNHVKWLLQHLKDNPHFFQSKVEQYFKNNNHKLTLIMNPVENFDRELEAKEKELLESKLSKLNENEKLQIFSEGLELVEHQKINDPSCLPTLKLDDVKRTVEKTSLKFSKIGGVPVQLSEQPTNEVVYFNAVIDASDISEEDILLLPLFATIITQMGTRTKNYKEFDQEVQLKTSGLGVSPHLCDDPANTKLYTQGILFSSYCLEKNIDSMFSLWKELFTEVLLEDSTRLTQLIRLRATEMAQGVEHQGHRYAMRRAGSSLTPSSHIREKMSGLEQVTFMKKLAEMENHEEILQRLNNLANVLFHKKPLKCSLNATPVFMPSAISTLETFINALKFSQDAQESPLSNENFVPESQNVHFVLPFSVNYLGQSVVTVPYSHPDFASLKVAAKLMSSKFLHSEIREKGGAYGGGASITDGGQFMFYSYRDPNVSNTLKSFSSAQDWMLEGSYLDRDIVEAKLGVFSEVDAPTTPSSRGMNLFMKGISDDMKEQMRSAIFACTREDLKTVVQKYLIEAKNVGSTLIGPRSKEEDAQEKASRWTLVEN